MARRTMLLREPRIVRTTRPLVRTMRIFDRRIACTGTARAPRPHHGSGRPLVLLERGAGGVEELLAVEAALLRGLEPVLHHRLRGPAPARGLFLGQGDDRVPALPHEIGDDLGLLVPDAPRHG